jgi:hypothetical protein
VKTNDMIGKLFTAAMFNPGGELCVEVDGRVYRITGDLRTEGDRTILQVSQEDVEKPPLPKREAPRDDYDIESKLQHPVGGFRDLEDGNWQIRKTDMERVQEAQDAARQRDEDTNFEQGVRQHIENTRSIKDNPQA